MKTERTIRLFGHERESSTVLNSYSSLTEENGLGIERDTNAYSTDVGVRLGRGARHETSLVEHAGE
jgi:hypothetical protein